MRKELIHTFVGSCCIAAFCGAPSVHAQLDGGTTSTDVCRQSTGAQSIACGSGASADQDRSTVVGFQAFGDGNSDVAVGSYARTSLGSGAPTQENVAIGGVIDLGGGVGAPTIADGGGSIAVGAGAVSRAERSIAIGRQASATGTGSVVLGAGSTDGGQANVVSFGNASLHRSLINVADITSSGSLSTGGNIASQGNITSQGFLTSHGGITSHGDIASAGHITSQGNITSQGSLTSHGGITSHGDIASTGDITSQGNVEAKGLSDGTAVLSGGNLTTTGAVNSGTLSITGSAAVGSGLTVSAGGASIAGGIDANDAKVTRVAGGTISATSTDAVNGSQLYATNQNVAAAQGRADAAQADALAALARLQDAINQLVQIGVCDLSDGTVSCGSNLQLAGGAVDAGASDAIAVGSGANAQSTAAIAVGRNATAVQSNSVAIGAGATAVSSVAVGTGAQATGLNTTAIGDNAVASGNYSAAFGNEAQAIHDNSVAIGNGSITSGPNTVSVGSPGNERRITNVAPGIAGTDAVNVDQLNAAIANAGGMSLTMANAYTDRQVSEARTYAARGIAAAAAMMNVQPSTVGKTALGVGVGHFDGRTAIGLSVARAPRESMVWSLGVAAADDKPVVRGGFAFEF